MARIRTVKPEFFQDEELAACSPHARLLAIALLQLCDKNGVFRNIPMQVHAHAFPWEAMVKVPALLGELEGIGYLFFYTVKGREYGYIPGFLKHQSLAGKEAQAEGRYPLPDQEDNEGEAKGKEKGSTQTLPGEAKGNAGTRNKELGKDTPPKAANGFDLSGLPDDLSPGVWADFLKARKALRKPISTQTAVDRLAASLHRCKQAGFSPDYALGEAIERGWVAVKTEWLQNTAGQKPATGHKLKLLSDAS